MGSIIVNDIACEYFPGDTVLDLARRKGIDIPSLCDDPAVTPHGCCRLCSVELVGHDKPVPACLTRAADGLVIRTESPRLSHARRVALELLLSDHARDCGTCDASGKCRLQSLAERYEARTDRFSGPRHTAPAAGDTNPFIIRDPEKCVLCGLCVRACKELEGVEAIRIAGKGFDAHVETVDATVGGVANCRLCGRCASICPTGALAERKRKGLGRATEVARVDSVCPHCGVGCRVQVNVLDDKIVGITSQPRASLSSPAEGEAGRGGAASGYLCVRGRYAYDFVHSPDRLTTPLGRRGSRLSGERLREVSWDLALDIAASGLQAVIDRHGPGAVAVIGSCRSTNEANYLLQKLARAVLGTNNIDNGAGIQGIPQAVGDDLALTTGIMANSFDEFERASLIVLVGSDPEQTHPVVGSRLKRAVRLGTRLIVVDPRLVDLAHHAETHLRLRVGSEVGLINALIRVILDEKLLDEEYIERHTEGFEQLVETAQHQTLEEATRLTGIETAEIVRVAREIAAADSVLLLHTAGASHPMCGHEAALALRNLALLTGNFGRDGAGTNALRIQNNAQGVCDMGSLPGVLPGYQMLTNAAAREKFEGAWAVRLNPEPGLDRADLVEAMLRGDVKALYVMGENPAVTDPNPGRTQLALERLELLVVQDIFPTETAQMADVVFPAAAWAEVDGTFTSTERRVQRVRAAVPSPSGVPSDWEIICRLSERMGYPMSYASPGEIWHEIASLCPLFAGITYDRLDGGGLQWPCTDGADTGRRHLHGRIVADGVRSSFRPVRPSEGIVGADLDEHYPLLLTTGQRLYHYQPGTTTQRAQGVDDVWPEDVLEVSPADAVRHKVTDGRRIRVVSRSGEMVTTVRVSDRTPEGLLFLSLRSAAARGRELKLCALDPLSGSVEYGAFAVRIESLEAASIGSQCG